MTEIIIILVWLNSPTLGSLGYSVTVGVGGGGCSSKFPTSEPLGRMGTSFGCRDFWDHLGGQVGISWDTGAVGGGESGKTNKTKKVALALPRPCRNYFINKQKADLFTD